MPFIGCGFGIYKIGDIGGTLRARQDSHYGDLILTSHLVRRFTPLEYERLQGYPDGWTAFGHDGRRISDGQRYRALGNSIAVPCVRYVMDGIVSSFRQDF